MKTEFARRIVNYSLFAGVSLISASSKAQATNDECGGYHVGFFNGMWSSPEDARSALRILKAVKGESYRGEAIHYGLYYNKTIAQGLEDLAEVWQQRMVERYPVLASHPELAWEIIPDNMGPGEIYSAIVAANPALGDFFAPFRMELVDDSTQALFELGRASAASEYSEHKAQLDAQASLLRKVVLVAHSQGSLFLNGAYDHAAEVFGAEAFKALHIAPASEIPRGEYVLADTDFVIRALNLKLGAGPSSYVEMPYRPHVDPTGHGLVATYLDPGFGLYARINENLSEALDHVAAPSSEVAGLACRSNSADCDGNASNGREADLDTDERNCGTCGSSCPTEPDLPEFTGFACNFARCNRTRPPAFVNVVTKVFGGPKVAADFPAYIASGWPPTVESPGYQPWDNGGRIPGSSTGTLATVGSGTISLVWLHADVDGYEIRAFEGSACFGFVAAGETADCTVTLCYEGICPE